MEPTKVVSLRISMDTYDNILVECDSKGINVTEWFETQIALVKKSKSIKTQLIDKLEHVYDFGLDYPSIAQRKLSEVIRFTEREL